MKPSKPSLTGIFIKFVGREVPMTETPYQLNLPHLAMIYKGVKIEPTNKHDPVLTEMRKTARENGLKLRLFWPGVIGTEDYRTDRVNAQIKKYSDGKWRVSPKFSIG